MKKVYEPLNMIMNGRYAVLSGKLAPELQRHLWLFLTRPSQPYSAVSHNILSLLEFYRGEASFTFKIAREDRL